MRVILLFICIFVIYSLHTLQCTESILPAARRESVDQVDPDRWRYVDCANAALTANLSTIFGVALDSSQKLDISSEMNKEKCTSLTLKVCCVIVLSIILIWKINTTLRKRKKSFSQSDFLRGILNAIGVGIISIDTEMKINYINTAAGNMCGCNTKLAIGKIVVDVLRFKDKEIHLKENQATSEDATLKLQSHNGNLLDVQQKITHLTIKGERVGTVILLLDVTISRDVIRKLSYRASHDALTGLPNRASFEKHLKNAVICGERNLKHVIAFVDLDGFKKINDGAGHAAGDELLKQIAQLMQAQLRHSDFVARLGGDEFGIILFNCQISQAEVLINKLVHSINNYSFCWEGEEKRVGASAGITNVVVEKKSVEGLLAEADAACYAAKRRGKGQVCVFEGF